MRFRDDGKQRLRKFTRDGRVALALLGGLAWGQEAPEVKIEKAAGGFVYAEGPVYSRDGYLLISDTAANRLVRLTGGERPTTLRDSSNGASGNAFDAQGRLYTCEMRGRRVIRQDKKGRIEVLAERYEGKRLNAPNDLAVREDHHVYFTDPAFGSQQETRELDFYGVYHLTPKGELEVIAKPQGRPNGIALSPDGKKLYVTNADEKNVRVYDLDRAGKPSNERVLIAKTDGVPGGLKVDDQGNLYLACRGLALYAPDGKLRRMLELGERPSNCTLGDGDQKTLYITARTSVYRVRLDGGEGAGARTEERGARAEKGRVRAEESRKP